MTKAVLRRDKYFLRDLHHEIDLYDRKLADLSKYVEFATPGDRDEAAKKLLAKRAPLEKTARELAASGVEYDAKDLPRSFRADSPDQEHTEQNLFLVKRAQDKASA